MEKVDIAIRDMYRTIRCPQVWKPSLYMYLSLALSISTHEGQFYWYTDPKAGPAFSQVSFNPLLSLSPSMYIYFLTNMLYIQVTCLTLGPPFLFCKCRSLLE